MKSVIFTIMILFSSIAYAQNYTGVVQDVHQSIQNQEVVYVIVVKVHDDLYRFYTRRQYSVGEKIRVHVEVSLVE